MSKATGFINTPSSSSQSKITYVPSGPVRHHEYYLSDGNVVFLVEDHLFRVHQHFFTRESEVFSDMLSIPAPLEPEGSTDNNPIRLPQISSEDFENLLWVWYKPDYEYDTSAERWGSILHLSHLWDFHRIRALAITKLEPIISPIDRASGQEITILETTGY